ncbi:fimbrial biogenesis chaperone [Chryseobacterium wangxinyae]|uniref:fimbrial biogenesis chaperone n=1 Tax=Chryseobacterium sp. CY353 TaxID=2997334 RepID=UPI00226DF259|nr:molecular chaperone [Chryseobacterium sp. CY353]MCY0970482.1 molecular chaperone [Chryseobacterium sp. CY353]
MRTTIQQICILFFAIIFQAKAQTGISVSPPRLYFESAAGISNSEKITVTNVSAKNTLDLAVSLGDWQYDAKGENQMYPANSLPTSCASWISIKKDDTYFSLGPGERRDIELTITSPTLSKENLAAHTALLYVSQMNPVEDVDSKGANIKVSIRSGIKIFHKKPEATKKKLEITDLKYDAEKKILRLHFENQADIWVDGKVTTDILNVGNGKKTSLSPIVFYTMPGNKREMEVQLPTPLDKGNYTASVLVDYGDSENLEMGELNFNYE